MRLTLSVIVAVVFATALSADGPADNQADKVRRVPPPGIVIPEDARKELADGVAKLGSEIEALRAGLATKPAALALLPDVQIFHKSVGWALRHDEFYRTNEVDAARNLLKEGSARAAALRDGKPLWPQARGLVVRGYVSKIDGSVQPYGLVVPEGFDPHDGRSHRLDFWFHGRGENLTELAFLNDRMRNPGEFTPRGAFVLHLYGRYCNGSRFAGETDLWEAFADVKRNYPIDEDRLVVRGFSLGGASCWHFATHFASRWAAAAPGAGFSETADFLKVFQNETLRPAPWEQKLWGLYDSTTEALNVGMVPLVAYSGEIDGQKQAAEMMANAMAAEGLSLTHLIGPKTGHKYEASTKAELNRRIDAIVARGRDPLPKDVRFVTHSLRHNEMAWVTVDGLGQHWEPARVEASFSTGDNEVRIVTTNVTAITLTMPPGLCPFNLRRTVSIDLDGDKMTAPAPGSDRSWTVSFHKQGVAWRDGKAPSDDLRKRHGLQGPIDDAFMDSFLFVRPTGQPLNPTVGAWVATESAHAAEHWRRQYRGEVRLKDDSSVTDADIADHNLVLWGDPSGNTLLAKIADRLPIRWTAAGVVVGGKTYPADSNVPVLIFPNPLNPSRYVVLNSGFTFREYDYLNNARQTPKLPDWAVIDISKPVTSRAPGGIAAAGFFGEKWELKP